MAIFEALPVIVRFLNIVGEPEFVEFKLRVSALLNVTS